MGSERKKEIVMKEKSKKSRRKRSVSDERFAALIATKRSHGSRGESLGYTRDKRRKATLGESEQ